MKKHLPSLVFLAMFCLMAFTGKAQWVTIPDTAFVTYLQTKFPACMSGNQMDTTCSGIVNAHGVYCSHVSHLRDLTGIQYFDNLDTLNCSYDSLTALTNLPATLRMIDCSYNRLNSITALPASLTKLVCTNNPNLTTLPVLPNTLIRLFGSNNQFTTLPALSTSLVELDCDHNSLTSLPALPASLMYLYCGFNAITTLPALPANLSTLSCEWNQINALPASLPATLFELTCYENQIPALPPLPAGLYKINCAGNQISTIPLLPASLSELTCGSNLLTSLPSLPPNLHILFCEYNQLTSLPAFPPDLWYFDCSYNNLTSLPELPLFMNTLHCGHNPNLTCFPQLKQVNYLAFDSTGITCLPNYPQLVITSNPSLDTVPLCDPFNANACSVYWNINGKVYNDTSSNCVNDAGETNLQNIKVNLYQGGTLIAQNYTGNYGLYSFDTNMGTFNASVDTAGIPFVVTCPIHNLDTSVITLADSFDFNKDFALQCKPGFDVGAWGLVPDVVFRPAHTSYMSIHVGDWAQFWGQNCNTNNLSGQVVITISGPASFTGAAGGALTPVIAGNTLTYNVSNWAAVNPNTDFNIIVQTDTTATLGSQVCFDVNVTPTAGDNNLTNNHVSQCYTVVSSYDPNEKEVYPPGDIDTLTKWLTYTIRFQNTGIASAEHIYVTDTLDTDVDPTSFQLLAYSHEPIVQIKGNAVRFNFPNINLPDSNANETASHGYVQYKVKLKNNLPVGTTINNTAYIYFDFNAPVVTNTTTNTIGTATGIQQLSNSNYQFSIYPNPATNSVTISVDDNAIGSTVTINDITGRRVAVVALPTAHCQLPTPFPNGIYFVTIGNATRKLVISK